MSQRGKRQNRLESDDPPPFKRRKGRPSSKGTAATVSSPGSVSNGGSGSGDGSSGGNSNESNINKNSNIHSNEGGGDGPTADGQTAGPSSAGGCGVGGVGGGVGCMGSSTWQARPLTDVKMSSIYNRSAPEAPAELFRKDLISAMKLPDSEPLSADEYWIITDQWKQEWERGVQVPVSPDSLPEPMVLAKNQESFYTGRQDFKL